MMKALVAALLAQPATTAQPWARTAGSVRVTVDQTSFAYTAALLDSGRDSTACGLREGGGVAFRCEGINYVHGMPSETPGAQPLKMVGAPATGSGQHPTLGNFDSIGVRWQGGVSPSCSLHTEIRYFSATQAFVFQANFSELGVANTSTAGISTSKDADGCIGGWLCPWTPPLLSAFPSWPAGAVQNTCTHYSYQGNSLSTNSRQGPLSEWQGGMQGGPLLLLPTAANTSYHPPALLLSPMDHPKSMIGHNGTDHFANPWGCGRNGSSPRVSFGIQGYVEELPASFSHATVLAGRQGVAATQLAWGETVRRHSGTTRLSLDQDPLNSKLIYLTDAGSRYCYCYTFKLEEKATSLRPGQPASCPTHGGCPMHTVIKALKAYHASIGLQIDMYHLDSGFWHSAEPDGHCDGVIASNWSASEFHWPHVDQYGDGLGPKVWGVPGEPGSVSFQMLYMLLAGSKDRAARPGNSSAMGNVYGDMDGALGAYRPQGGPWPMVDSSWSAGGPVGNSASQVHHSHAHAYWDAVLGYAHRQNNLRAMVVDTLNVWWGYYEGRLNNTHAHEEWMDGYFGPGGADMSAPAGSGTAGGASKWKLPIRFDIANPNDHLATATQNWPATTSVRLGGDFDGGTSWTCMATTGAFAAALHLRPILTTLWTVAEQPGTNKGLDGYVRPYVEHEIIVAVLTTGVVGFGDSLPVIKPNATTAGGSNLTRLLRASRSDSVLLKPAHPALRLDLQSIGYSAENRQVFVAPCVPARAGRNASTDRRANSFARSQLANVNGSISAAERWFYTLLATELNVTQQIKPAMLFPVPPTELSFVVSTFSKSGATCHDGTPAASCVSPFSATSPFNATTELCPCETPRCGLIGSAGTHGSCTKPRCSAVPGKVSTGCRFWNLYSLAPVLAGGWALLGEQEKYVAVSPQRFVTAHAVEATDEGASDALVEAELQPEGGQGLRFTVVGAVGENVSVSVLVPSANNAAAADVAESGEQRLAAAMAGKVVVLAVTIGTTGQSDVICAAGVCKWHFKCSS
jgi:hypothetical protein